MFRKECPIAVLVTESGRRFQCSGLVKVSVSHLRILGCNLLERQQRLDRAAPRITRGIAFFIQDFATSSANGSGDASPEAPAPSESLANGVEGTFASGALEEESGDAQALTPQEQRAEQQRQKRLLLKQQKEKEKRASEERRRAKRQQQQDTLEVCFCCLVWLTCRF